VSVPSDALLCVCRSMSIDYIIAASSLPQ
jgi:hypothetical protein